MASRKKTSLTALHLPPLRGLLTIRTTFCLLYFAVTHSFLPCLALQFCRSEGSSLHRDIIAPTSQIQQECLHILLPILWFELLQTGLIQTSSSQHTSNTFLFKLREHRAHSHQDSSCTNLFLYVSHVSHLSHSHLLSALLDLIPKESNFALTQNSRSKRQSPDFMAFMGIRHSVQNKPLRGILLVRKEGDYSEPV